MSFRGLFLLLPTAATVPPTVAQTAGGFGPGLLIRSKEHWLDRRECGAIGG
jgi:hypothetical protein